jgi:hypothetical protein
MAQRNGEAGRQPTFRDKKVYVKILSLSVSQTISFSFSFVHPSISCRCFTCRIDVPIFVTIQRKEPQTFRKPTTPTTTSASTARLLLPSPGQKTSRATALVRPIISLSCELQRSDLKGSTSNYLSYDLTRYRVATTARKTQTELSVDITQTKHQKNVKKKKNDGLFAGIDNCPA